MNSAPAIILTREERTKLESLATDPLSPRALRRRAQAILVCAEGNTNLEVACEIGITNLTVGRWRREFLLNRLKDFGVERRGRPVRPLLLTFAERRTLQGWLRSPSVSAGLATRARVILACAQGASNVAVASEARMSEQTVSKLRQRFLSGGLIGLRPGQPGRRAAPSVAEFG
jgi:transposase